MFNSLIILFRFLARRAVIGQKGAVGVVIEVFFFILFGSKSFVFQLYKLRLAILSFSWVCGYIVIMCEINILWTLSLVFFNFFLSLNADYTQSEFQLPITSFQLPSKSPKLRVQKSTLDSKAAGELNIFILFYITFLFLVI